MGFTLYSLLAFIVAISILVAVHEYGHYIVGRWTGMKVLRFSIGFGTPIWKRVGAAPDHTEYCISSIPLGGYVRFLDGREGPVPPEDEGRAFNQRPIPSRILVLLAGPAFNFLLAILIYWALFVVGERVPVPTIGAVEPGSYAAEAGLRRGDRIIRVGEVETQDWEPALIAILDQLVADGAVRLTVTGTDGSRRVAVLDPGDDVRRLTEPGELFTGLGISSWRPSAEIGDVVDGGAGAAAGIRPGDVITRIDGEDIGDFFDLARVVSERPDEQVEIEVLRDGRTVVLSAVIGSRELDGQASGFLNVAPAESYQDMFIERQYGVVESIGQALDRTWTSSVFTVKMIGRMITGDVSIKNISGPINIAQFAGTTAQRGLSDYIDFLAIVSISLGIINLFPIPLLDGGQIVYQLVEWIKGSPLSERAQIAGQQIGILALILLMSFAFYNDIARIIGQ